MITRRIIPYKKILFFLIGLYTVLPDYFKIAGINSALILAIVIFAYYFLHGINWKINIPKDTYKYCFVYLILGGVTHFFHGELNLTLRIFIEYVFLFIIIVKSINNKIDMQNLINIVIGFGIFEVLTTYVHFFTDFNIFSLIQSSSLPPYSLDSATQYRMGMIRVEGSFGHAITYAIYISICACLCLYMYNLKKEKKYLLFYFLCIVSLILSISRMPIIVFFVSQLIYLCSINLKKTMGILGRILAVTVPMLLLLSVLAPNFFDIFTTILQLISDVFSQTGLSGLTSYQENSAFTYRAEMIRVLPELISKNPLLGIGGDSYRSDSFYFLINGHKQTSIDNEYFHTLLLYGVLGLAGLVWQVLGPLLLDKRQKNKQEKEKKLFLYKVLIIFIYAMNLFSVAQMFEYRMIIVVFAVFFAEINLRTKGIIEQ